MSQSLAQLATSGLLRHATPATTMVREQLPAKKNNIKEHPSRIKKKPSAKKTLQKNYPQPLYEPRDCDKVELDALKDDKMDGSLDPSDADDSSNCSVVDGFSPGGHKFIVRIHDSYMLNSHI